MDITYHHEIDGRTANIIANDISYKRIYQVETSSPAIGELVIYNDPRTPKIGDPHPSDQQAICHNIDINHLQEMKYWTITAKYSRSAAFAGISSNPINAKPDIKFGYSAYNRVVELDNSAGDPLDPPLTKEKFNLVIYITQNQRTFRPADAKKYKDSMNSSAINIAGVPIGKHEGRMRNIEPTRKIDQKGNTYFAVTYEIEIDNDTHTKKILDIGFYYIKNNKKIPILDGEGNPVTEPQKLDGSGNLLAEGAKPYYLEKDVHTPVNWGTLRLPRNL